MLNTTHVAANCSSLSHLVALYDQLCCAKLSTAAFVAAMAMLLCSKRQAVLFLICLAGTIVYCQWLTFGWVQLDVTQFKSCTYIGTDLVNSVSNAWPCISSCGQCSQIRAVLLIIVMTALALSLHA